METVSVSASPPDHRRTIQWVIVGVWVTVITAVMISGFYEDDRPGVQPIDLVAAIVSAIAQASWVTLDCQRNRRPVGWWRFGAILLGPIAIWMYLAVAYGRRALYLIPISMLVYAAPILIGVSFSLILPE